MTQPTNNLPAARPRKVLTQIASVSWEHPADRAALQSLRSVPGFDLVVKKIYGFIGERGIRLLFQGMDRPFIVINSGALKLLDDDEMRTLLGHELGHVMSGHALYVTILILILNFSFATLPFLAGIALLPIRIALLEWFRKSELSSDRAGLLSTQDPHAAMRMYLKMAGGGDMKQMDLNEFLIQAKEYEEAGGALDRIFQILNTLERTHPFNTLRAAELQRWIEAGHYERILNGEYTRRGPDAENRPIDKDIDEARDHYMKEAKAVVNDVVDSAKRAAQAFSDAFKKK
ncbi:MAG: peptidase M48 [Gemmatimonadetes bacterium]|nr:MAG: peptidase M48 [Gemmatimonadota bacterium]